MKASRKLTRYMLIISVVSSFGVWFCISKSCIDIQNYLLEFKLFSVFLSKRSIVIDILLSISVTAWFAAGGFIIDYFNKKSQTKKDLLKIYNTIREECFDKILFEDNYYKTNPNEVRPILNYLYKNMSTVTDYQLPLLKTHAKISKFIKTKIRKNRTEPTDFQKENKYALILFLYSILLDYFVPLNIIQTQIKTEEKTINHCQNKIAENNKLEIYYSEYNTYLEIAEKTLKKYNEKIKVIKFNKDVIYKVFYAIDNKFIKENGYSDYFFEEIFYKDIIVKDSDELSS